MKNLKSNILLSTLVSAAALFATASNAAESNKLQEAYKSSNVKSALINVCKEETVKSKKLSAAECVNVFIAIDGPRLGVSDDLVKVLACRELASGFNKANPERNRFLKS